jgi:glycosyltransferase involved in cell wall biosynthesis
MVDHGTTGLLVPTRDPEALADAINSLLEQPVQAYQMTRRARREVENYTWPRVCSGWTSIYRDCSESATTD